MLGPCLPSLKSVCSPSPPHTPFPPPAFNVKLKIKRADKPTIPSYCKKVCAVSKKACAAPDGFYNVNYPSFSLPHFRPGKPLTVKRRLTYVGDDARAVFTPTLELPPGYTGAVTALMTGNTTLAFAHGSGPKEFSLTITASKSALPKGEWAFGSLTWTDAGGTWSVRSAIALRRVK